MAVMRDPTLNPAAATNRRRQFTPPVSGGTAVSVPPIQPPAGSVPNDDTPGWGNTPDYFPDGFPGPKDPNYTPTPSPKAKPTYAPVQGFDFEKINGTKPYDSASKYSDALRTFSAGLGSGVKLGRNALQGMIDYAHANGFTGAKAVGDDKIDFGDGNGPIDVIQSNGSIWFQNGDDRFGDGGAGIQTMPGGMTNQEAENPNWEGTGMTEREWRMRYPVPGAPPGTSTPTPGGGGGGGTPGTPGTPNLDLKTVLSNIFNKGGDFNQNIVDQRVGSAQDDLLRQRSSQKKSNQSELASRGLLGDGAEYKANASLDQDIDSAYANQVGDIYSNESQNADSRMMQALQISAGMTAAEAQNAVDMYRAQSDNQIGMGGLDVQRMLGMGNLALGNRNAGINERLGMGGLALGNAQNQTNYTLGMGRLGLDRDTLMQTIRSGNSDDLIRLLQLLMQGAGTTSGGHI